MGKLHAKKFTVPGRAVFGIMFAIHACDAAVESVTETFVGIATVIAGQTSPNPRLTCFSIPVVAPAVSAGTVTAVGSTSIQDANANWAPGQFSGSNGKFYVELDSGCTADVVTADATTKTLALETVVPLPVAVGEAYRIRRHLTLADLLGPNNEAGLKPGGRPSTADSVTLFTPGSTANRRSYFYSDVAGNTGWYRDNITPAGGEVIHPHQGLMVQRKSPEDVVFYVSGLSRSVASHAVISPGYNLVGALRSHGTTTLAEMNLFTGDLASGMAAGFSHNTTDFIQAFDAEGRDTCFFYCPLPGAAGWYDWKFQSADSVAIAAGTAFFVYRRQAQSFLWNVPSE